MNSLRLLAVFLGAAVLAWAVVVVPITVLVLTPALGLGAAPASFLLGMLVGGLAGPLALMSRRVSDWVG